MRSLTSFREDERAIEGLPIRLVIAIVVGVAALSVMMTIIDDVGTVGEEELNAAPEKTVLQGTSNQNFHVNVTDNSGTGIANATVIIKSGTANLDSARTETTNYNGTTLDRFSVHPRSDINWRSGQTEGTIKVDVRPPGDANYKNDQMKEITIINPDA